MPTCEGAQCAQPITHITAKGYITCTEHAPQRGYYSEGSRTMRPWEIALVEAGKPVPSYRPISKAEAARRGAL